MNQKPPLQYTSSINIKNNIKTLVHNHTTRISQPFTSYENNNYQYIHKHTHKHNTQTHKHTKNTETHIYGMSPKLTKPRNNPKPRNNNKQQQSQQSNAPPQHY